MDSRIEIRTKRIYVKSNVVLLLMGFICYFWHTLFNFLDFFQMEKGVAFGMSFYVLFAAFSVFVTYGRKYLGRFSKKKYRTVLILDYLSMLSPIYGIVKYPLSGVDFITYLPGVLFFAVFNVLTLNFFFGRKMKLLRYLSLLSLILVLSFVAFLIAL